MTIWGFGNLRCTYSNVEIAPRNRAVRISFWLRSLIFWEIIMRIGFWMGAI